MRFTDLQPSTVPFSYRMLRCTVEAHLRFSPPAVFLAVLVQSRSDELLVPHRTGVARPRLTLLPANCAHGVASHANLAMAMNGIAEEARQTAGLRLISEQDLFTGAYSYLFVVLVQGDVADGFNLVPLVDCEIEPPATRKLIDHLVSAAPDAPLRISAAACVDERRERATLELKRRTGCMPLVTVNGLVFSIDDRGRSQGVILARRAATNEREGGKWSIPAGFPRGHESAVQALARETGEEIGLMLDVSDVKRQLLIGEPSAAETDYINWSVYYEVHTRLSPGEFWTGPNDEIEAVRLFEFGDIPLGEMAFDHGSVLKQLVRA